MGLILKTDDKGTVVYRKDKTSKNGNAYSTFTTKVSSKNEAGEWVSAWYELAFKKDAEKPGNKAKIVINNSFPIVEEYNGNVRTKYMVMDFKVIEEGEAVVSPDSRDYGFMNVPADGDLPFAAITHR